MPKAGNFVLVILHLLGFMFESEAKVFLNVSTDDLNLCSFMGFNFLCLTLSLPKFSFQYYLGELDLLEQTEVS